MPDLIPIPITATVNGRPLAGQTFAPGSTVTVTLSFVAPAGVQVTAILQDASGRPTQLGYAKKPPYAITGVVPADVGNRTWQIELQANRVQIGKQQFAVKVAAPASDTGTVKPPVKDTDPVVTVPPVKAARRLKIGLCDAAKTRYDVVAKALAPMSLYSVRVWQNSYDYDPKRYKRDDEAANAIGYERAGVKVRWVIAQDGATPAMARTAVAYALVVAADQIKLYDANAPGRTITWIWGNEPDLRYQDAKGKWHYYWGGTVAEYAAVFFAVCRAVKSAHPGRFEIFAAGFSWDIAALEKIAPELVKVGDGLTFHGYPASIDAAGMQRYARFSALCQRLDTYGLIGEGAPAARGRDNDAIAPDWSLYLGCLDNLPGIAEVLAFNAQDIGTTNSAGAWFDKEWNLTACGRAVKGAMA